MLSHRWSNPALYVALLLLLVLSAGVIVVNLGIFDTANIHVLPDEASATDEETDDTAPLEENSSPPIRTGPTPPATAIEPPSAKGPSITGSLHTAKRTAVADAEVSAHVAGNDRSGAMLTNTGKDGKFRVEGVDSNKEYDIKAQFQGESASAYGVIASEHIGLMLGVELFALRGSVIDEQGLPVSEFTVEVQSSTPTPIGSKIEKTFKSVEGVFSLFVTGRGTWNIAARSDTHFQKEPLILDVQAARRDITLTLTESGTLTGKLLALHDRSPVPGIRVFLAPDDGSCESLLDPLNIPLPVEIPLGGGTMGRLMEGSAPFGSTAGQVGITPSMKNVRITTTNEHGVFAFSALPPAHYGLVAVVGSTKSVERVTVIAGKNERDLVINLGAVVAISAQDATGSQVPSLNTRFLRHEQKDSDKSSGKPEQYHYQGFAADSRFRYAGIRPGFYQVEIGTPGYKTMTQMFTLVEGENFLTIQFTNQSTSLHGTISASDGRPIQQIQRITLRDSSNGNIVRTAIVSHTTHLDGSKTSTYVVEDLPAETGEYEVVAELFDPMSMPRTPYIKRYSATVAIAPGLNTHDIAIDIPCRLIVTVCDEAGAPVSGAYVIILPEVTSQDGRSTIQRRQSIQARFGKDGNIAEAELFEPGRYRLEPRADRFAGVGETVTVNVGLGTTEVTVNVSESNCVEITSVVAGSLAEQLGLVAGDKIVSYGGVPVRTHEDLRSAIAGSIEESEGAAVALGVLRDGNIRSFDVPSGKTLGITVESARQ
ncbi:MAG: PDZ domain-containing protein [Planctomycetaceae bacterium]|nr:PDZ domain-containing protein [Planctomycetaceae bacterium]